MMRASAVMGVEHLFRLVIDPIRRITEQRIRREEQLPVYERLGDVRARAVTMGQIADVLQQRGETEETLRIRREEELPVYERLGDVRARAITIRKIEAAVKASGDRSGAVDPLASVEDTETEADTEERQ